MITPKQHLLIDYALVGGLLLLPTLLKLNKKARKIYAAEAAALLPYVAMTQKGFISYKAHSNIDPFNIAQFALQSLTPPFRKSRKTLLFNLAFTAIAGATVALTNWKRSK